MVMMSESSTPSLRIFFLLNSGMETYSGTSNERVTFMYNVKAAENAVDIASWVCQHFKLLHIYVRAKRTRLLYLLLALAAGGEKDV